MFVFIRTKWSRQEGGKLYIKPADLSLAVEGKETGMTTGMSLTAEINVGKRRIIEFFIYPIIKYLG